MSVLIENIRDMNILKITEFADPICTWCWGSSPIIRALEYRFKGEVEINYVMTGMIEDIRTFNNRRLGIGGDIEMSNRNMMKAWLEASAVHGMPVQEHGFHLFSEQRLSSIPMNLAYIAAKICSAKGKEGVKDLRKAKRFLRRIQEATAVEAMHTNDSKVLADLAAVEGFEPNHFLDVMNSNDVHRAFEADKALCKRYNVQSTPTYLLEYKGEELLLHGFTTYNTLEHNIKQLTYGKVLPCNDAQDKDILAPTNENVREFIAHYGTVYPVEIATAFCLERIGGKSALNIESYKHLPNILDELLHTNEIEISPQGNGFRIIAVKNSLTETQKREREYAGTF